MPKIILCVLFAALTIGMEAYAQPADRCSDILQGGIFNQYRSLNQTNLSSKLREALCNSTSSSNKDSAGGGASVGLPIEGIPIKIGGDYNQQHAQALKTNYCQKESSDLDSGDSNWVMQQIASKEVVDAWLQCRLGSQRRSGLSGQIEDLNGSNFAFRVRWTAELGVAAAKVTSFTVRGASCDPIVITAGTVITTEGVAQPCTRNGSESVFVVINTDYGPAVGKLDEIKKKTTKDKCMEGSATACSSLAKELQPTCGTDAACIARAQCWGNKSRAFVLAKAGCPENLTPEQAKQCDQLNQKVAKEHQEDCDEL